MQIRVYINIDLTASSDLLRIVLLFTYGGIYLDTDVISVRPLGQTLIMAGVYIIIYDPTMSIVILILYIDNS